MGVLKSIFSWLMTTLGFFVLLTGVFLFTMSFVVSAMDSEELYTIADAKIDKLIEDNLESIKKEQNIPDLTQEQIKVLEAQCVENPESDFCDERLFSGELTQDELMKEYLKEQMDIKGQIESTKNAMPDFVGSFTKFATPLYGLLIFALGVLIIFIGKSFNVISSLGTIFYESAFAFAIAAINFKIMPSFIEKMVSANVMGAGSAETQFTTLIPEILLAWLGAALNKAFIVSLTLTIVFVVAYIILLIVKKKTSSQPIDLSS